MLKDTQLAPEFSMIALAEATEGHSGSDLRELCRNAAMVPVREIMRSAEGNEEMLAKGQLEVPLTVLLFDGRLIVNFRVSKYGHSLWKTSLCMMAQVLYRRQLLMMN
jgi:SpoVK/Ycf46/Vps4 family AAA+-type ATPase